jgi:uncharacterized protein (DUF2147 family)
MRRASAAEMRVLRRGTLVIDPELPENDHIMRSLLTLLCGAILTMSQAALADPSAIEGTWLSGDGDGLIEIKVADPYPQKGSATFISARILGSAVEDPRRPGTDRLNPDPALRDRELIGLEIFEGFRYDGDGEWSGGFIYDPNSGRTYRGTLKLIDPDTLKVRGFIGISLIGRTETWKRR